LGNHPVKSVPPLNLASPTGSLNSTSARLNISAACSGEIPSGNPVTTTPPLTDSSTKSWSVYIIIENEIYFLKLSDKIEHSKSKSYIVSFIVCNTQYFLIGHTSNLKYINSFSLATAMADKDKALVVFQGKKIRRTWFNDEWWFSVVDVVGALTESGRDRKYWSDLKSRLQEEGFELSEKIGQLKLMAEDGKLRSTDCANTKNMFRIIQSIPSKKAEPFKLWLAQVGYDRVQEIGDPELVQKRMKELYRSKGYSDDWIEKRVRGIAIRDELTDEWRKRGVREEKDYSILTAQISKATFGMTPGEYKEFKRLKRENLRDHMNDLELIFSMLGERVSTEITREEDAQGYEKVEGAAKRGRRVAGNARINAEKELGRPVSINQNYLNKPEKKKKLQDKQSD
jgi:DNA-damage-inducible protein D